MHSFVNAFTVSHVFVESLSFIFSHIKLGTHGPDFVPHSSSNL